MILPVRELVEASGLIVGGIAVWLCSREPAGMKHPGKLLEPMEPEVARMLGEMDPEERRLYEETT